MAARGPDDTEHEAGQSIDITGFRERQPQCNECRRQYLGFRACDTSEIKCRAAKMAIYRVLVICPAGAAFDGVGGLNRSFAGRGGLALVRSQGMAISAACFLNKKLDSFGLMTVS